MRIDGIERGKEQNEAVINYVVVFCMPPQIIYRAKPSAIVSDITHFWRMKYVTIR